MRRHQYAGTFNSPRHCMLCIIMKKPSLNQMRAQYTRHTLVASSRVWQLLHRMLKTSFMLWQGRTFYSAGALHRCCLSCRHPWLPHSSTLPSSCQLWSGGACMVWRCNMSCYDTPLYCSHAPCMLLRRVAWQRGDGLCVAVVSPPLAIQVDAIVVHLKCVAACWCFLPVQLEASFTSL